MNLPKALAVLFIIAITSSALAADPVPSTHWYRITIAAGANTLSFTGSSPLDASALSDRLTASNPITLQNRREQFADPKHNLEMGWHPWEESPTIFIMPRAVLCIEELPADPAATAK